jgi:hypothetical protein
MRSSRYFLLAVVSNDRQKNVEIRLRAKRRAGELLREMEKALGTRGQLQGQDSSGGRVKRPPEKGVETPTLSDLGVIRGITFRDET